MAAASRAAVLDGTEAANGRELLGLGEPVEKRALTAKRRSLREDLRFSLVRGEAAAGVPPMMRRM